jgi:hypothetical protein
MIYPSGKRYYTNQMWKMLQSKDNDVNRSIYVVPSSPMNKGLTQAIFLWMRSGEWLSNIMADELWKINRSQLKFSINQLRRRGWIIDEQTFAFTGIKYFETYTQYRITNWKPESSHQ